VRTWNAQTLEFLGSILLVVACIAIAREAESGRLSAGAVGFALSNVIEMPRKLMWLSIQAANLETAFISVERIAEYAGKEKEFEGSTAALPPSGGECGLAARDVWFRYSPSGPWVLQGLTFNLDAGARAAVVGRTGCGKSSLLSVCVRLYHMEHGSIRVHDKDVSSADLWGLRKLVRVLLQDPILFSGTVRSNLLCLPDKVEQGEASLSSHDAALSGVLEVLGLADIIEQLGGLGCMIEEAGRNLSQGQKQLLCLARTLAELRLSGGAEVPGPAGAPGPRLVLCDEPTSSCDLATDAIIHRTLLEVLPRSLTVVVVCHRLHRVRSFDTVMVMDAGRVLESGKPADLLKEPQGKDAPAILRNMCIKQGVL